MGNRISRRRFLSHSGAAIAGLSLAGKTSVRPFPAFDIVLKNATVLDGTGAPPFAADLGISGDTIAAISDIAPTQAGRVIDCSGLQVCPGFIDIHTHSDGTILAYPTADSRIRQGITTELTGNCGGSAAPLAGVVEEEQRSDWKSDHGIEADWNDVASYFARVEKTKIALNHALLIGQGTLRNNAVGTVNRPLDAEEMRSVMQALDEGLDQGAFGLSTGLEYTPGRYTPTEELVQMSRLTARRGGLYASHIRNEEAALLEAVNEAIEIGRRSGVRVQIAHLKAAGRVNWDKQIAALELIESARRGGIGVLADAYPYTAYSTGLTILMPDWALEGGTGPILKRLRDVSERSRIRKEVADRAVVEPGGWDLIVISGVRTRKNQVLVGKNLLEIADIWKLDAVESCLRLIEEEETSVSFIGHAMSEDNVERVLRHPLVMIGSDGSSMAPVGKAAEEKPHPRSYGTFARVLGLYSRERRLFDLATAVRKMTSMPADQIGLPDRGRIARGKKADLVIFDAAAVKDTATFDNPHRYPQGIIHVLVNGTTVVESGIPTGARPGRVLRKS